MTNSDKGNFVVHSDKKRKPRYYVTFERWGVPVKVVYENASCSKTVQWAIDHCGVVTMEGTFTPETSIKLRDGQVLRGVEKS